jgi:hypothetical protein
MAPLMAMILRVCQHSIEPHSTRESLNNTQIDLKLAQATVLVTGGAGSGGV